MKQADMTQNKAQAKPLAGVITVVAGSVLLTLSILLSVAVGAADIDLATVWQAIWAYDSSVQSNQIIMQIRLPRELGAALVGAGFAVSGAIMQGLTRNPIADPGLLGLNAGASLALACTFAFLPEVSYLVIMLVSFAGAAVGAGMVFGLGALNRQGMSPLRLTLAGAAVTALLTALGQSIGLHFKLAQDLAFWVAGGVSGTNWLQLKLAAPIIIGGILVAFMLSRGLTILSFGEDVAKGLGQRTILLKSILMIIVLLLAGASVSIVGSIAFVGLMIPQICKLIVGSDYRLIIPCSAVLGSVLLVLADTAARTVNVPYETPIGAIVAIIGFPCFLYLTRRVGRKL